MDEKGSKRLITRSGRESGTEAAIVGQPSGGWPALDRLRISVALCTCNGERYLEEQLQSILAQGRLPDEVVICDDVSTDRSLEIAGDFARRASFPVRIVVNDSRLGSTKNFEKAIRLCEGDVIALSDQDDCWYENRLSMVEVAFLGSPSLGLVCSDADLMDEDSHSLGARYWKSCGFNTSHMKEVRSGRALNVLLRHNIVCGATSAFRSELRDILLPIPEITIHDLWIALLVSAVSEIGLLPACSIKYRKHSNQQVGVLYYNVRESVEKARRIGAAEYLSLASQYTMARDRVLQCAGPDRTRQLRLIEGKIRHMSMRASLPPQRWRRLPTIFRQTANCDYFRYSEGLQSIAKDLLL